MAMIFSFFNDRNGVAYSLLAIVFVSVFVIIFVSSHHVNHQDYFDAVRSRVLSVKHFINNFERDLDRVAFIAGYRSLIAVDDFASIKGSFFSSSDEFEHYFMEAFVNGSVNGTPFSILDNSSFNDYLSRVRSISLLSGINLSVNLINVSVRQFSPWEVVVFYSAFINVSDVRGVAWWSYHKNFSTVFSIIGLRDPLYSVNTLGRVPYFINNFSLPPEGFVSGNDTSVLRSFIDGHYYINSSDAPSFLQRFYNDLSPSPFGIESIVYLPDLSAQGLVVDDNRSVVDHVYFSSLSYNKSLDRCSIQGLVYSPDWFRLDDDHVSFYDVDNLSYSSCS